MARGRLVAWVVSWGLVAAAACSNETGSNKPLGSGDHLIVDVDSSDLPTQPDNPTPDDAFAPDDAQTAYNATDAYAVLTICAPPDGGKGKGGADAAASDAAAAPDDAATAYADGGTAAACQPIPAACTATPTCDCLFKALASQIPCAYPHCGVQDGFNIYCP
jgi:hypothetical protein